MPFSEQMRKNIADVLDTDIQNISVKATTEKVSDSAEGLKGSNVTAYAYWIKWRKPYNEII